MSTANLEPSWPPTGWLTRKQAAERLKLSYSRVAALGGGANPKPGEIHTSGQKSPYSGQNCTLYHAGDVERLAFERENPTVRDSAESLMPTGIRPIHPIPAAKNPDGGRYAVPSLWGPAREVPALKPWLTISEAAEYLGLPASTIERLVKSGTLPALDCGPRPGGKWRVKRSDLDALEGDR